MNHFPADNTAHTEPYISLSDGKTALLLVEYQHEWLGAEGKLRFLIQDEAQMSAAVAASEDLVALARQHSVPIVHAGLRFNEGYPELGQARYGLRAVIPRVGTFQGAGADFVAPFVPQAGEFVISGRTGASAFSGSNLDAYLRHQGISTLLIAGFALHVCIESTLRQAHDLGYDAIVVTDASAAFTSAQRKHVIEDVIHHFGAAVAVADVANALKHDAPRGRQSN